MTNVEARQRALQRTAWLLTGNWAAAGDRQPGSPTCTARPSRTRWSAWPPGRRPHKRPFARHVLRLPIIAPRRALTA